MSLIYCPNVSQRADRESSRARVLRLGESEQDARALRLKVVDELRRAVGFDAYAWLLTDPETAVGTSPLADVPWLSELPRQIRLKYLTPVNRWTSLGDSSVALLHEATGGDPSCSLVWREFLAGYGIGDVASVVFQDRFGCWAFLELWREQARGPFDRSAADFLFELVAPLTRALRRLQAENFVGGAAHDPLGLGPVVLLLSPDLEVRAQTSETEEYLRILVPPADGVSPVPASAYNVAAQLLAVEADVDHHPPSARVHVADGLWMTVRAARIGSGGSVERDIAVTIERTTPVERADLFARAFGLSAREAELLRHLVEGSDTSEVAARMFLSANTVQDHLKSIFAKTAVRSRRALLTRALGS